ncbi:MAG: glycosyltransferase [Candidatus Dojkabacteria bacterium]
MKTLQIIGPYFTNYSLARINRGLAAELAKNKDWKVTLFGEKDKIDYVPTPDEIAARPEIKNLVSLTKKVTDIAIYNNFPKAITNLHGLKDLPGKIKIIYIAWEETIYPKLWVEEINEYAHGVMATSNFTKEILVNCGVKVPVRVIHNAMDEAFIDVKTTPYPLNTNKKFKFLHISSAKKRKGIDVLLKAYFSKFTKNDDVTLVIKSFPGPDNDVDKQIAKIKKEDSPEIIHINNPGLSEQELANLHSTADCEVYPSRAEGFGLPILESMYLGIPLIATNYSAYLDFCNGENTTLIDYKLEFAKDSELVNLGAKWAEPNEKELGEKMREIFEHPENFESKTKLAKETAKEFTWIHSAKQAVEFLGEIEKVANLKEKNLAVLTPINDESGIADYSKDLYKSVQSSFKKFFFVGNKDISDRSASDEVNELRLWKTGEETFADFLKFIDKEKIDIVHIQYHSGYNYPPSALSRLIDELKKKNIEVFVTLHAVRNVNFDFIKEVPSLKNADKVLIHSVEDFEYAKGTLDNVILFKHFNLLFKKRSKVNIRKALGFSERKPIIATHGLLNTNKGIPEVIKAVNELKKDYPEILLLCLNAVSGNNIYSTGLYKECLKLIEELGLKNNVKFFTDFLKDEIIEVLLQSSDMIVFNYSDVGESASAAVRKGLASLNPVVITNIKQFSEFSDECFRIPDNTSESIRDGIKEILNDENLQIDLVQFEKKYIEENNVEKKALDTLKLYK